MFSLQLDIAAPVEAVYAELLDFETFYQWIEELSRVRVLSRRGNDADVEFRSTIQVRDAIWQFGYNLQPETHELSWNLVKSNILSRCLGSWCLDCDTGGTRLQYRVDYDIQIPVSPGIRNRIDNILVGPALQRGLGFFKQRIEQKTILRTPQ